MKNGRGQLPLMWHGAGLKDPVGKRFAKEVREFAEFGTKTKRFDTKIDLPEAAAKSVSIPTYVNEFWTARQRQANSLHEISYRACFKPQLPRFFISRLTQPEDVVYDPFMGRGTTLVEAGLLGRVPYGCDVSPVCSPLVSPRLVIPEFEAVEQRLNELNLEETVDTPDDLLAFYHPETLTAICCLRAYLLERETAGALDPVDAWIRMVALNRLTGHSPGFFSVYSLPPNQAVSVQSQRKINEKRKQVPPVRDVRALILKKSRRLLAGCSSELRKQTTKVGKKARLLTQEAEKTPRIRSGSVSLVVTSPPFLDVVDYATDNWLRCWFIGIDAKDLALSTPSRLVDWEALMTGVFLELNRVLKPGGFVAFEVGEVRKGSIRLEESVLRCGFRAGLEPGLVMINDQEFTKTANCWGVDNNQKGTNTNRIVVFSKPLG